MSEAGRRAANGVADLTGSATSFFETKSPAKCRQPTGGDIESTDTSSSGVVPTCSIREGGEPPEKQHKWPV
jgi:hypothetical protein